MLEKLLRGHFATRWFFFLSILGIILLIILKFFVIPAYTTVAIPLGPFNSLSANITSYAIDAIITTLLTTVILATFFLLFIPKEALLGEIEPIHPKDIQDSLTGSLKDTREYWFRGRSGRYFRSEILPRLINQAKKSGNAIAIYVLLPDPSDSEILEHYADYRNSSSFPSQKNGWTVWNIQREILATIIAVAHATANNLLIEAKVGVLTSYSLLRLDINSTCAILTREDPKLSAIKCNAGNILYDTYREEIRQGMQQGKLMPLDKVGLKGKTIDNIVVSDFLRATGYHDLIKHHDKISELVKAVNEPAHPYS